MRKIIAFLPSVVFVFNFFLLLLIFHPIQYISKNLGGYKAHKLSVDILNYLLLKNFLFTFNTVHFSGFQQLKKGRPLIIVSNHQSSFDISPVVWGFRDFHPKFISKKELGKGIPSISYNLNHGGSVLIDRRNNSQAIRQLFILGRRIEENNFSACIFPEGTRSKTGKVRKFKSSGIKTLLKASPSALVVPFAIEGNYRLQQRGSFPLAIGQKLRYTVLKPIEPAGKSAEEIVEICETMIKKHLQQ